MGMHVVIIGSPMDGMKVYGPFKTAEHAHVWLNSQMNEGGILYHDPDWWVVPLHEGVCP